MKPLSLLASLGGRAVLAALEAVSALYLAAALSFIATGRLGAVPRQ